MAEPRSWSDETYFGIGAAWGLIWGFAFSFETFEKLTAIAAIAIGSAAVGGLLGVALREDIFDLIVSFFF